MFRKATLAGIAGSFAMDLMQDGFTALFDRTPVGDERDEETEAIVAVVRRISPYVPGNVAERYPGSVGRLVHYVFGCAFALAYESARARVPAIASKRGSVFGLALWLLSDVILIPATRLGRPWGRYSPAQRLNAVLSHVAYATAVEGVLCIGERPERPLNEH